MQALYFRTSEGSQYITSWFPVITGTGTTNNVAVSELIDVRMLIVDFEQYQCCVLWDGFRENFQMDWRES